MSKPVSYKRHRFPPEIIAHAVWLYFRFPLSLRLVEEMLLERGILGSEQELFPLTRLARTEWQPFRAGFRTAHSA
jgi:hypothetical protein